MRAEERRGEERTFLIMIHPLFFFCISDSLILITERSIECEWTVVVNHPHGFDPPVGLPESYDKHKVFRTFLIHRFES